MRGRRGIRSRGLIPPTIQMGPELNSGPYILLARLYSPNVAVSTHMGRAPTS